jgi:hypothetical protein
LPNDRERPRCREFASRGSGVQIPSAPPVFPGQRHRNCSRSADREPIWERAVADWLGGGLPGRTAKTIETKHDALKPLLADLGSIRLAELTAHDVRAALTKMAERYSTRTLQKAHNCLTRVIRHAEAHDLVRRNVSALFDTPEGQPGRPSQSLTPEQAAALLEAAAVSRLHAFIVLC